MHNKVYINEGCIISHKQRKSAQRTTVEKDNQCYECVQPVFFGPRHNCRPYIVVRQNRGADPVDKLSDNEFISQMGQSSL